MTNFHAIKGAYQKHKRWYLVVLVIGGIFLSWLLLRAVIGFIVPPVSAHPIQERNMAVIAHRGGRFLFPENTILAFGQSLRAGADVLEMDVHLTRDQQLVVLHDSTVDRTTNGSGEVANFSLAELKDLDAAYWWLPEVDSQDTSTAFVYRGLGISIPSLEEVLTRFPTVLKIIEMKSDNSDIVNSLGRLLRKHKQEMLVIVASFNSTNLKNFRRSYPEFATSATMGEIVSFFIINHLGFAGSYFSPAEVFQVPIYSGPLKVLTPSFIRNAQKNNIIVQAWTINELTEMNMLLDMGIDSIITDDPSKLLSLLDSR